MKKEEATYLPEMAIVLAPEVACRPFSDFFTLESEPENRCVSPKKPLDRIASGIAACAIESAW
jgi:hypothetical protein